VSLSRYVVDVPGGSAIASGMTSRTTSSLSSFRSPWNSPICKSSAVPSLAKQPVSWCRHGRRLVHAGV